MIFPSIIEQNCPLEFYNEKVFYVVDCIAGTLTNNATLPDWITFDLANERFIGAENTYSGATAADANAAAQAALETWVNANLDSGDILCAQTTPETFKISGYTDGVIGNPDSNATGDPVWDGTFNFFLSGNWMASAESDTLRMDGFGICNAYLRWEGTLWEIRIYTPTLAFVAHGPATENSPVGTYTNTGDGADDTLPATVAIVANNVAVTPGTDIGCYPI